MSFRPPPSHLDDYPDPREYFDPKEAQDYCDTYSDHLIKKAAASLDTERLMIEQLETNES